MANGWNMFWNVFVNLLSGVDHLAGGFKAIAEMGETEAQAYAELSSISREDRVKRERARLAAIAAAE